MRGDGTIVESKNDLEDVATRISHTLGKID